jgi:D-alanyl-D-alanine carboxypeptidase
MMSGARLVAGFSLVLSLLLPARASAGPTLLFEPATGRVLYAEDMDDQWHPASLTKMMTAYVTFQAIKAGKLKLDTPITYSEAAHKMPPSKIGLPVGATLQVDIALQSVIVKSANDIALALAEAVGGSEEAFVEQMNQTARRLGMTRTVFRNPHGLHAPEQVSTARDLARLATAVVRDFPEHAHYWAQSQMQFGQIQITSHNGLFKTLPGTDGIKTGFICDSGYNMVASTTREGVRLMAVVLGERTAAERNQRAAELLEHGYLTREWKALLGVRQTVASLPLSPEAKDAASIRNSVISIECTNRRMARVAAAAKRAKARNAKAAKKQAAQQQAGAPGATAATGVAKAKAPPAPRTAAPATAAAPAAK